MGVMHKYRTNERRNPVNTRQCCTRNHHPDYKV